MMPVRYFVNIGVINWSVLLWNDILYDTKLDIYMDRVDIITVKYAHVIEACKEF